MKDILDAKGLLMHAFYACKQSGSPYRNLAGEQIASAEAAFTSFLDLHLLPILTYASPIDVIAVWEGGNTRRIELFPEYKLKRRTREKDPVLEEQLDKLYGYAKDLFLGLGISMVRADTVEGDDTIAYIATGLAPENCIVHTGDKDLVQLMSDTCSISYRGEFLVEDDLPVPPNLVAMNKAIVGDTTDEYGGVKGMGEAAWNKLIKAYGDDGVLELEQLIKNKDRKTLKSIVAEEGGVELTKLSENFNQLCIMYQLAVLHPEWCTCVYKRKLIKPEWHRRVPNTKRVTKVLDLTGNSDRLDVLEKFLPVTFLISKENVDEYLYSGDLLDDYNARPVAFDYETDDPNQFECFKKNDKDYIDLLSAKITGASFAWGNNYEKAIYIPFDHLDKENNCDIQVLVDLLKEADELIAHNSHFEETVSYVNLGDDLKETLFGKVIDTMIMSNYVDENERDGLKHRSKHHLNYDQMTYREVLDGASGMSQITSVQAYLYGTDDSVCTAHLYHLYETIMRIEGTLQFMLDNERITNSTFSRAYRNGCPIDEKQLELMRDRDAIDLKEARSKLRGILLDGCDELDLEATERYMEEVSPFEIAKAKEAEKTEEQISEMLAKKRDKFYHGTKYEEYVEKTVLYDFIPTVSKFKDIFMAIDPELSEQTGEGEDNPIFLSTVAPTKISEQFAVNRDNYSSNVLELMQLVCSAAHQFKARAGEEYEALKDYVQSAMAHKAKIVTAGDELNFDSPDQSAQLIYGKLALPIRHYSKVNDGSARQRLGFSGPPATNNKAIEIAMAEDAPEDSAEREVLELVVKIKTLETQFKFYYNPYPNWVHPLTGNIHPSCRNCGTKTRRPTGGSPNILQVKKGPIRSTYLPPVLDESEGEYIWVAPDFAGQELRILGSESGDQLLYEAYMGAVQKDVHSLTGSAILPKIAVKKRPDIFKDIVYDEEIPGAQSYDQFIEWRESDQYKEFTNFVRDKRAKGVNFLVNYEGGAGTLSTNLLVPEDEAQEFIDGMFRMFPGIPKFQAESHQLASQFGYVSTAYGNRRHMTSAIASKDNWQRLRMERQGSNFRIQGCAADILKVVIADCERTHLYDETKSILIAPVYDELVNSVPTSSTVEFCQRLQKIMDITPPGHTIPMVSEFSLGFDWYNMVEIGTDTSKQSVMAGIEAARIKRAEFKGEAS